MIIPVDTEHEPRALVSNPPQIPKDLAVATEPGTSSELFQRRLLDLLTAAGLKLPQQPIDGDCLVWTPKVVELMRSAGHKTDETTVIGWLDPHSRIIAFVHRAALLDGDVVIDVTARQFATQLPPIWVAPTENYCAALASATGVAHVTIGQQLD